MTRLDKLKQFLIENKIDQWLAFDCRGWLPDIRGTMYEEDGIRVDVCYDYEYSEIFGLTKDEWETLRNEGFFEREY